MRYFKAVLFALVLVSAQIALAAGKYEIVLNRPSAAGETYTLDASVDREGELRVAVQGQEPGTQKMTVNVRFIADVAVQGVNARGKVIAAAYTVRKFTSASQGGAPAEVLAPGVIVTARAVTGTRETSYTVNGAPASQGVELALSDVVVLYDDEFGYDETIGTDSPKSIGESWPVSSEALAKEAAASGATVKPGDISGASTLADVVAFDGVDCLKIVTDVNISAMTPPQAGPEGWTPERASAVVRTVSMVPLDRRLPQLEQTEVLSMKMTAVPAGSAGIDAPAAAMEISMVGTRRRHITNFAPAAGASPTVESTAGR